MKKVHNILVLCGIFLILFIGVTACVKDDQDDNIAYPPMIMVDGKLYQDTGYVNSSMLCGTCDGEVKTSVDASKKPAQNDESNFGKGYGYQFLDENMINVKIDDDFVIFKEVGYEPENDIPNVANYRDVAYFDADVIGTDEDNESILLEVYDIPKRFTWIFNKFSSLDEVKPIRVSLDAKRYPYMESVFANNFKDKKVRIYFDGKLKNTEAEMSNPMECNNVYCIEIIGK